MIRDAWLVMVKDLRLERRSKVGIAQVLPFAVLVLMLLNGVFAAAEIAVGADAAYDRGDLEIDQVATTEEALAILSEQLRPGDIVLIKSSNGAGLRFLGDQLLSPEALR